ncbi:MAG: hypothetical protein WCX65_03655 [bacterium]
MPHEPTPIQKTAARWGLVSMAVFIIGALGIHALYVAQKHRLVDYYLNRQKETAWTASFKCLDYLDGIESSLKSVARPVAQNEEAKKIYTEDLKKYLRIYGGVGVESVGVYDKNGLEAAAGTYFSSAEGPSPKHIDFIHSLMQADKMKTAMTDVTPMKGPAGQIDAMALVAAASGTERLSVCGQSVCPAFAVAMVNTRSLSYSLQRLFSEDEKTPGADSRPIIFAIDGKGFIISHPSAEYIGANAVQTFDLEHNPEFEQVIQKMKNGESGTSEYVAAARSGKGMARWLIAYSPAAFGGNRWSIAVAFQERDVPFLGGLFKKYLIAAFVWFIVLFGVNAIYLRSRSHSFRLERRVRQLADSAAVNDILRNVNTELNEAKRKLEVKTKEFEAIHHEREAMLERLEELQKNLFASISRPTRENREAMREMRRIVRVLSRPPEGRFWKHMDDE